MHHNKITEWLFANGGPILRYRIAVDLMDVSNKERARLLQLSLATIEVKRWLKNLEKSRNIHGSKDINAENALSKLLDYGLDHSIPVFDKRVKQLLERPFQTWDSLVILPFLLRAGYLDHPIISEFLQYRIKKIYQSVQAGIFDFYLSPKEASLVPKAWRGKPIYRDEFGHQAGYSLPTCFDFYAISYCPPTSIIKNQTSKFEAIAAFLSDTRFQSTIGGYGWDRVKRRCYAAGRVFLACTEPTRLILFLELGAIFNACRQSEWFQQGMSYLEKYRTLQGTYCFPLKLMTEKSGNHIYGGSHMGIGENRRSRHALELESTFRMLYIYKRMQKGK